MLDIAKVGVIICLMGLSACTTTEVKKNTKSAPADAANAPVKALNLKKREIPEFLTDVSNPYADGQVSSCSDINAELSKLTEFLGPDWDSEEHYSKVGGNGPGFFDAVLPYGGLVRFASGASKHEKKVLQAVDYASVRRAHLKTIKSNKGC